MIIIIITITLNFFYKKQTKNIALHYGLTVIVLQNTIASVVLVLIYFG